MGRLLTGFPQPLVGGTRRTVQRTPGGLVVQAPPVPPSVWDPAFRVAWHTLGNSDNAVRAVGGDYDFFPAPPIGGGGGWANILSVVDRTSLAGVPSQLHGNLLRVVWNGLTAGQVATWSTFSALTAGQVLHCHFFGRDERAGTVNEGIQPTHGITAWVSTTGPLQFNRNNPSSGPLDIRWRFVLSGGAGGTPGWQLLDVLDFATLYQYEFAVHLVQASPVIVDFYCWVWSADGTTLIADNQGVAPNQFTRTGGVGSGVRIEGGTWSAGDLANLSGMAFGSHGGGSSYLFEHYVADVSMEVDTTTNPLGPHT